MHVLRPLIGFSLGALLVACGGGNATPEQQSTSSAFIAGDEDRLYTEGMTAWRSGDLEQAEARFRGSLEANGRYLAAHIALGDLLLAMERPTEALQSFDAALALRNQAVDAHMGRARALTATGQLDDAETAAETAVMIASDVGSAVLSAETQTVLGAILVARDRSDDAIAAYERALELDAGTTEARVGLARLYAADNRMPDAVRVLGRAGQYETDPLPLFEVGRTFHEFSLYDRALEVLEAANAGLPQHPDILYYYASSAVRSGRAALGIQLATELIALDPSYLPAYVVRGEANLARQQYANARADADTVIQQRPDDYDAIILEGDIAVADEDPETAEAYFQRALSLYPERLRAADHLASLYYSERNFDGYIALIEPQINRPDRPEGWLSTLIDALVQAGRESEAVPYQSELALSRPTDHLLNYQTAARALRHPGMIPDEQVLAHAEQAVEHIGGAPLAYRVTLIDALLLNGRRAEAEAVFDRAWELFPQTEELQMRRDRL